MPRRPVEDQRFAARLRELLDERGLSYRALAARTFYSKSQLHDLATGRRRPTGDVARRLDEAFGTAGELAAMVADRGPTGLGDEMEALVLLRRVEASDVSGETLRRLEEAVDDLATEYAKMPPEVLLSRIRRHLAYVSRLVDARKTVEQQRRLVTAAAWLSLLAATVHIDLRQTAAADARLVTADQLARHVGYDEIRAWCLETQAWDVLTAGDYAEALKLSQQAQAVAPAGSSAHIQATAQEGRAWARLGRRAETRRTLDLVARQVAVLPIPERPDHHYQYDPSKALAYTATTLAWAGDPAAEEYARAVVSRLEVPDDGIARPRRVAAAQVDLALALVSSGQLDEAAEVTTTAVTSGRIVPSNWWRVSEVVAGIEAAGAGGNGSLREAYATFRPLPAE